MESSKLELLNQQSETAEKARLAQEKHDKEMKKQAKVLQDLASRLESERKEADDQAA